MKKENDEAMSDSLDGDTENQDIKMLKETLMKEKLGNSVLWLQEILIEACYSKIVIANKDLFKDSVHIVEPVPYCYSSKY